MRHIFKRPAGRPSDQRCSLLRAFLKNSRSRITPAARALGTHARLPSRLGRRVTQEEVAEAVGVSRVWYAQLESGAAIRVSPQMLDRLAAALTLTAAERAELFRLALPELYAPSPACGFSAQSSA